MKARTLLYWLTRTGVVLTNSGETDLQNRFALMSRRLDSYLSEQRLQGTY